MCDPDHQQLCLTQCPPRPSPSPKFLCSKDKKVGTALEAFYKADRYLAEDKVLEYFKKMNRPYGAVDVAANLKGAVPKTAVQKILVVLAEKGELVSKTYGKTTFFVANQANIPSIPAEEIATLKTELQEVEDGNKALANDVKNATAELARLKNCLTDAEIQAQIVEVTQAIKVADARLAPLQSGTPLISEKELGQIDADWIKWRAEWIRRKKIFMTYGLKFAMYVVLTVLRQTSFWQLVTDALPPQDAQDLAEDLGIEMDTEEHVAVERSPLCAIGTNNPLKRKR
ncbi:hypothetical protein AX16_010697 [Volvariella volvacea WC 439]|nr:hypothetical protein AX16_010697 [Volvariella volvacea WC 439]